MTVSLASVALGFSRGLTTIDHLLAKGLEHCAASGASEEEMLGWRLAEDMHPLRRQVQFVCNLGAQWAARAAGVDVPADVGGDMDVAELRQAIAASKSFIDSLDPGTFAGRDDIALTIELGQIQPTLPTGRWVGNFATTNFLFHLSIAYAVLRSKGVPLGKPDLFAGGL